MHRKLSGALAVFSLAAALAGGFWVFAPAPAEAALFAAGSFSDGICTCPMEYGDCVCKIIK